MTQYKVVGLQIVFKKCNSGVTTKIGAQFGFFSYNFKFNIQLMHKYILRIHHYYYLYPTIYYLYSTMCMGQSTHQNK